MEKASIYFQVAAEGGVGKTHAAVSAFPRPFLIDCTPHGDGRFTAMKVFRDEFGKRYSHARSMKDVIEKANEVVESGEYATLCLDEYKGLRHLGQKWHLKTTGKKTVFPVSEWGIINSKIGEVIWNALDSEMNVVVTSGFSSIYKDGEKTDGRSVNSPPNAGLDIDFRVVLVEVKKGTDVEVRVMKNKFKSIRDRAKTMKFPLTWKDIKEEILLVGFEYCE